MALHADAKCCAGWPARRGPAENSRDPGPAERRHWCPTADDGRSDAISSSFNVVAFAKAKRLSIRSSSKAWVSASNGSMSAMTYGRGHGCVCTNRRKEHQGGMRLKHRLREPLVYHAHCAALPSFAAPSSSAASPVESVTPAASTAIDIRCRTCRTARAIGSTDARVHRKGPSRRTKWSTLSRALLSRCARHRPACAAR